MDPQTHDTPDQIMTGIADQTGATLHAYPRPGHAQRHVILRDTRDNRGTRFQAAQIEDDGTLRITGHDTGPRVSESFGTAITSYEWVYVVAPDQVGTLLQLLGGEQGDDVLHALAAYHQQHAGQINELLRGPEVAAEFANWHS